MPIEKRGATAPHRFHILWTAQLCEVDPKTNESRPMPPSVEESSEYGLPHKSTVCVEGFDRRETILKLKRWLESAAHD
jgi:hypothetical protein